MSTYTSEPGTRLGGRYRLEDRVAAAAGWAAWKAIDETLARAVTVFTLAPGFPRIRDAVTAARAASRLSDSRLTQVFDVEDDWDRAYIVMEWPAGDTLDDLLTAGPLDPGRGARIVAEAAGALSVAHAAGLAHLCLTPESLRWTAGGGVKVVGLGIGAALAGTTAEDPALADTRGLGRLLYAALTGHWPGHDYPALPSAPVADGLPRSPRQVRAGVPAALDDVTCQALLLRDRGNGQSLTTPAQLATALSAAIPPAPLPQLPPAPSARARAAAPREDRHAVAEDDYWPGQQHQPRRARPRPRPRRAGGGQRGPGARIRAAVVAVLVLVVMVAVVAAAFQLRRHPVRTTGNRTTVSKPVSPAAAFLTPLSAHGFDAYNLTDTGNENDKSAALAIDGNPSTAWTSQYYFSPVFGGLKPGSGLMLDMGKSVRLTSVRIQFGQSAGASVRIEIGNTDNRAPATVGALTIVGRAADVSGTHTFAVHSSATGRYVLIWFTKLPPMHGSAKHYMAEIFNIVLQGSG
jgi:hypothetical protein